MTTTDQNKVVLTKIINQIHPVGGTNINSGMELAFRVLKDRKK